MTLMEASYHWRRWRNDWREELAITIAWWLPPRLVKWCAIRVAAQATQGEWSTQVMPELTALEAVKRWDGAT